MSFTIEDYLKKQLPGEPKKQEIAIELFNSGRGRWFDAEEVAMRIHENNISDVRRHLRQMAKKELPAESNNRLLCSMSKDPLPNQRGRPRILYSLSEWFWNDYSSRDYVLYSKFHGYCFKEEAIIYNKEGDNLYAQGKYAEALQAYNKAIEQDPKYPAPKEGKERALNALQKNHGP